MKDDKNNNSEDLAAVILCSIVGILGIVAMLMLVRLA